MDVAEPHVFDTSCHGIEARGEDDNVKHVQRTIFKQETLRNNLSDWIALDIGNMDGGPIKLLIEVLLESRALGPKWLRTLQRAQNISLDRIVDSSARLSQPEIVCFPICLKIEEHVF